jgi:hypothetical protein
VLPHSLLRLLLDAWRYLQVMIAAAMSIIGAYFVNRWRANHAQG